MRRDLRPITIAAITAVVSCGLLMLAVRFGWLGPDVGRGANFCEAPRGGAVRQPANSFSNLGFVTAGLLVALHAGARGNLGSVLSSRRRLATAIACLIVLLGPASAAMHATQSAIGGHLDMLSMYLVASFAAAYAAMRWWRGGTALFAMLFAGGVIFCEIAGLWYGDIPVVMYSGNVAFGLLLITAVIIEVRIMRRGETVATRGFAFASLAAMLIAFAIWNAAKTWLCDPVSLIQGHAIWHVLGAVSAYFLYRYYASENNAVSPAPPHPAATEGQPGH
jgi:hypothetical protein